MSAYFIASSVVALLVALFNALLAGYVLASGWRDTRQRLFALAPVGVALFALSWFVLLVHPDTRDSSLVFASWAALLSVSGFVGDALLDLGPSRTRRVLLFLLGLGSLVLAALSGVVATSWRTALGSVFPEALALGAVAFIGVARLRLCRTENAAIRRLSRHLTALVVAALTVGLFREGIELARGGAVGTVALLCVILASESMALSYILHDRVEVRLPVARAVTHALLAIGAAFLVVALLRALGYSVDLGQMTVTVGVALVASLLFVGLGDPLSRGLEFLLFPKQARLTGMLSASRAEAAALRSRLERAERLAIAGELAASVAHEIKNPLAALRGYAELLGDAPAHVAPEQRARFEKAVRIIREESDRIDAKVAELLSLGRAPKGRQEGRPLDVARVVLEAVAVAEGEVDIPHISARLDPTLKVVGDEDELRGVLLNLLKNAGEAMRGGTGGRIEVVAQREEDSVAIEVRDEGQGLGAVDREQLFRPFYTTKSGGTGLGLAISRSAIEAAGGKLSLLPREDRVGAVARVVLPAAPQNSGAAREETR
ncbi:sensor histidine kinase [Hyalangium rubrum]|uniref:histidine kinase n=1 Tax=Hyalangium rubrum TaxID=3103134 RepID=A0ABU5HD84_9BACT|nr:ATP-binding protein [Hyalangium sp. s54d21]MDY7231426.1 ATP-binding protein [Hyalangium sp. s54d21]